MCLCVCFCFDFYPLFWRWFARETKGKGTVFKVPCFTPKCVTQALFRAQVAIPNEPSIGRITSRTSSTHPGVANMTHLPAGANSRHLFKPQKEALFRTKNNRWSRPIFANPGCEGRLLTACLCRRLLLRAVHLTHAACRVRSRPRQYAQNNNIRAYIYIYIFISMSMIHPLER